MKPCALCLWTGSELPGGYSTVHMNTSFPGNSGRGLVISGVTTGSAACTAVTPSSRDNRRADFIFFPLWVASGWSPGTRGSLGRPTARSAMAKRRRAHTGEDRGGVVEGRRVHGRCQAPWWTTIADVLGYTRCHPQHRAGDAWREARPAILGRREGGDWPLAPPSAAHRNWHRPRGLYTTAARGARTRSRRTARGESHGRAARTGGRRGTRAR